MKHQLWAGTEESFAVVLAAQEKVAGMLKAYAGSSVKDLPEVPSIWRKEGNLATVDIAGSLIPGTAGWMGFYGVCGYDDISAALIAAASDPEVKSILLLGDSPGGSVNGAQEVADLIASIAKVKPVAGHVEETCASAGYWLLSSASTVSVNAVGEVGSIGVLTVHTSYARMLAESGVDKQIIRSGANKAVTNSIEPLSEAARADMQTKVDDVAAIFLASVTKHRGDKLAEANAGAGKVYLGKRAVTAGLADKVMNYDQAVSAAKRQQKG